MATTGSDTKAQNQIVKVDTLQATTITLGGTSLTGTAAELNALAGATNANNTTGKVAILGTSGAITFAGAITPTGGVAAAGGFTHTPLVHTGDAPAMASTDGTDSTPVITEVYYAQVTIPANCSVTGVANFNGSVASGNIKVGLADSTGAVVATSASTAMSGTDTYQKVAFTAPYSAKGPATYYVLLFIDNTTARVNTWPVGAFVAGKQTGQTYATGFTTITPGSTFTANLGPIATLY